MQLLIKQRVFSWTDTYDIYDASGNPRYFVKADFFAFGHQIHVYDKATGQEVGAVHQRLLNLLPKFEIVIGGRSMGFVQRKFNPFRPDFLFRPHYTVDFRGWTVIGNLMGWDYDVIEGNRTVMSISKKLFQWGDTYSLNFADPADELAGLLLVIAIDAANCEES